MICLHTRHDRFLYIIAFGIFEFGHRCGFLTVPTLDIHSVMYSIRPKQSLYELTEDC